MPRTTAMSPTNATNATNATLTRAQGVALLDGWTRLWNGDLALVAELIAPGFRLRFGNTVPGTGPDSTLDRPDLGAFISAHRQELPGLTYAVDGLPTVDGTQGEVAARWTVTYVGSSGDVVTKSGIDLLAIVDGRIAGVWSLTGDRRFAA
ncbi:nuclear transport factor 2 family protein [Streptomyces sp. NPDC089799]|uniref:nuclear transport factor 2 family protein n=1 Tax=Streptomyces sp. NPDC089799 TaxID=3155066 RepID=UPI0034343F48